MKMTKRKNPLYGPIRIALLVLCTGLFIWSIWPHSNVMISTKIERRTEFMNVEKSCGLISQLLDAEFLLKYPKSISYQGSGLLIFQITPKHETETNHQSACSLVVETFFDMGDVDIQPGSRIFEPFKGKQIQTIIYHVLMDQRNLLREGNFWVYAVINQHNESESKRLPLFVFPIKMEIKQIFGIPPAIIRTGSLFVSILLFASSCYQIKKTEMI